MNMKKALFLFVLVPLVAGCAAKSDKYVSVRYDAAMNTNFDLVRFIVYPRQVYATHKSGKKEYTDAFGLDSTDKQGQLYHKIMYLTKDECSKLAKKNIEKETGKFDFNDESAVVSEGYVMDYWRYRASLCIPKNIYANYEEKCGVAIDDDDDGLIIPETPFVCDKYSKENPIPRVSRKRWIEE